MKYFVLLALLGYLNSDGTVEAHKLRLNKHHVALATQTKDASSAAAEAAKKVEKAKEAVKKAE